MQPAKLVAGTPKIPGFLRRMELIEGTVAGEPLLAGFQKLLRPTVIQALAMPSRRHSAAMLSSPRSVTPINSVRRRNPDLSGWCPIAFVTRTRSCVTAFSRAFAVAPCDSLRSPRLVINGTSFGATSQASGWDTQNTRVSAPDGVNRRDNQSMLQRLHCFALLAHRDLVCQPADL